MTATTNAAGTLPRWDLDALFPGPNSPELRAAIEQVQADAASLLATLASAEQTELTGELLGTVIDQYNALLDTATRVEGYLYCLVAADVTDEAASAASSTWDLVKADLGGLAPRFTALIASARLDDLAAQSTTVAKHLPTLTRVQELGGHLMPRN
jgi:oligoendopeptidase F